MAGATSLWDLAVITRLEADAPLVAATSGIYSGVAPQAGDSGTTLLPWIVLDDTDFLDYHTADKTGFEILMRIYTISRSPGRKQVRDVQDLLLDALHRKHASMAVAGHTILFIDRDGSTVEIVDEDGSWRGECNFRSVMTKDAAD